MFTPLRKSNIGQWLPLALAVLVMILYVVTAPPLRFDASMEQRYPTYTMLDVAAAAPSSATYTGTTETFAGNNSRTSTRKEPVDQPEIRQ